MVNDGGQLYTIEGVAAGLIMLLTAFIVINSTSVYTPGDTHISDMQLEVVGSDALLMMNTAPNSTVERSPLETIVENDDSDAFRTQFEKLVNERTIIKPDSIHYQAKVTYDNPDTPGQYNSTPLGGSRVLTGGEHAVHVSRWVIVEKQFPDCHAAACQGKHAALVEVYLWRD
ncbi:hypothetical protein [uncultured Methanoregula sp.]|uniref:DUF7288 family protein n=1 Tax=uncultured Methanoregula sp. TaxID=1005933 RepID=UPI002AAB6939|nr:hypothetical protein [uncultured Methanoregula sp.]